MSDASPSSTRSPRDLALAGGLGVGLLGLGVALGRGSAPEPSGDTGPTVAVESGTEEDSAGPNAGPGPDAPDLGSVRPPTPAAANLAEALKLDTAAGYRALVDGAREGEGWIEAALVLHYRHGPSPKPFAAARAAVEESSPAHLRALVALVEGEPGRALELLVGDEARVQLYRAWAALEQEDAAAARQAAEAALAADPELRSAAATLAQARFALDRDDGLAALREAVDAQPDYPALRDILLRAERAHLGLGAVEGANADAERLMRRADLAWASGRRGEALGLQARALATDEAKLDEASGSGFPDFDPVREQVLFGQLMGEAPPFEAGAASLGQFEVRGALLARSAADKSENSGFWLAQGQLASVADGLVRYRVVPGQTPDLGLMFRVVAPDGWDQATTEQAGPRDLQPLLDGYSIDFTAKRARLLRWDRGVAKPLASSVAIPGLSDMTRIEVVVWLVGPQIVAAVYAGQRLRLLATLTARDTTYASGQVGWRSGPKQEGGGLELLTTMDTVRAAPSGVGQRERHGRLYLRDRVEDATPFGPTRYGFVPRSELAGLPPDLRRREKGAALEGGEEHAILALTTVEAERLRRLPTRVHAIDGTVGWGALDEAYRSQRDQPPTPNSRGFELALSYKNPAMVEALLRGYHERYPEISELVEVGRSHQDRPLLALKISDNPGASEDEPAVFFNGSHHSEELLSTEFALDVVAGLLEGYGRDGRVTRWVDQLEIWCLPMVNPDGVSYFLDGSLWANRKNGFDADGDGHLDPFEGVDLNRNYPFGWGRRGSSAEFTSLYFRGPSGGSEPETRAIVDLANAEHFAAAISFHTLGRAIFVPYLVEHAKDPKPNIAEIIALELVAAAPEQRNGRPYVVRPNGYPVAGSDQDWHQFEHGTVAYVLEGPYQNPPLNIRVDTVANTRPVWQTLLERVRSGPRISGHVRDASGTPVEATVVVEPQALYFEERWTSRPRDGRFDRLLASSGRYTVHAELGERRSPSQTVRVGERPVEVELVVP